MSKLFTLQEVNDLELSALEAYKMRVLDRIMDRVDDLNLCHKKDNCNEFGMLIESYIEEWLEDPGVNEWQSMHPQFFKVSPEEYAKLEKLLAEPPKVNERLRKLLNLGRK